EYVHGAKDRQAECSDTIRYVHDGRLHYLRNFQPHLPWGQYLSYVENHASVHAWRRLRDADELSGPTARYWQTKPVEELYDVAKDPWETHNLAVDPAYAETLERMRQECSDWMHRSGDVGLLSEHEFHERARRSGRTPYEIALNPGLNPLSELLAAAALANQREPSAIPQLIALLQADDAAIRRWGAIGLVALGADAAPAREALRKALGDASPDVQVAAAEALAAVGDMEMALRSLRESLQHPSPPIRLAALQSMQRIGPSAAELTDDVRAAGMQDREFKDVCDYIGRMVEYLPAQLNN
ncbi:MAG: HEAT repeat domain-containing protein, partial [Planctomycetaceae bacterium]|nr:HEAT repeat domain-containing protein [Planctomycetaceae bacterium]